VPREFISKIPSSRQHAAGVDVDLDAAVRAVSNTFFANSFARMSKSLSTGWTWARRHLNSGAACAEVWVGEGDDAHGDNQGEAKENQFSSSSSFPSILIRS
jgi:hypothetical protein